jgi:hypothetical protein
VLVFDDEPVLLERTDDLFEVLATAGLHLHDDLHLAE